MCCDVPERIVGIMFSVDKSGFPECGFEVRCPTRGRRFQMRYGKTKTDGVSTIRLFHKNDIRLLLRGNEFVELLDDLYDFGIFRVFTEYRIIELRSYACFIQFEIVCGEYQRVHAVFLAEEELAHSR